MLSPFCTHVKYVCIHAHIFKSIKLLAVHICKIHHYGKIQYAVNYTWVGGSERLGKSKKWVNFNWALWTRGSQLRIRGQPERERKIDRVKG